MIWRRPLAAVAGALGVVGVVVGLVGGLPQASSAAEPVDLDGVVLRWGLTDEANTAAFQPGSFNFPSAGASTGNQGNPITRAQWSQRSGTTSIEKWDGDARSWRPATWEGLSTDSFGDPLVAGQRFSNHQVVFEGGVGTLDVAAGTARVTWSGAASVLFYSGQSIFSFADPVLEIAGGRGTLTATASGFVSAREDASAWGPAEPATVTLASFSAAALSDAGFTVTPDYAGVTVDGTEIPQVRSGAGWGSFPPAFVRYLDGLGSAAFWYSTGGAADAHKAALPLTVAFVADGGEQPTPTGQPTTLPSADNTALPPPTATSSQDASSATAAPAPVAPPVVPPVAPAAAPPAGAPAPGALLARPATDLALATAPTADPGSHLGSDPGGVPGSGPVDGWTWWGASVALLLAAAVLLVRPARR